MSYKPDEKDWMAYLYGELGDEEKEKFDQYLLQNKEAHLEFEKFQSLRGMLSNLEDKEVIAPPIVVGDTKQRFIWNAPYFKTVVSIAASLLLIILVGKMTNTRLSVSGNEFKMSFGEIKEVTPVSNPVHQASLSEEQVQQMINSSLQKNNSAIQSDWKETQENLSTSIRTNLASNTARIDQLVRQTSTASQDQIRDYVAGIQTENMRMVKDYFQLTSSEQKKYVENLLVDFADYLQQQRKNDLQTVQTKLNSMEQNTDIFKQETEQILTSIITTVGSSPSKEIKN
jgi:hypothetical protein